MLTDRFDRAIKYLRISVTDRCDFRCTYCMSETMTFLPKNEVLSLEELADIALAFRRLGVDKLRVTGGEPLIRNDVLELFRMLGAMGFADLSLTTNGARLEQYSKDLVAAGVHRVNISLDSLKKDRFKALTRHGNLDDVLAGVRAARSAGFKKVKLNTVVMRNFNSDETSDLVGFAVANGCDISFIEEMPLGEITSHARNIEFMPSAEIRDSLSQSFKLNLSTAETGGPSRYWQIAGSDTKVGFISPHSENFCSSCNRVRVTAAGKLLLCLGNEHSVDLKALLRHPENTRVTDKDTRLELLEDAIRQAIMIKPEKHHFYEPEKPQILRFMNATGG